MPSELAQILDEFNSILFVCPCCGEVQRLGDGRPYLRGHRPETPFDKLERAGLRIDREEGKMQERNREARNLAQQQGRREAKKLVKKIDPVFCGANLDPQDVKVIFHPVGYVVFDGLSAQRLKRIILMANPPTNSQDENVHHSIERSLAGGNADFVTLRVTEDGVVERDSDG